MRANNTWLFVVLVVLAACFASGQGSKKNQPPTQPANPPKPVAPDVPIQFGDPDKTFDLPSSWPAPVAKPEGKPEQAAVALAKIVTGGGPNVLAALERAALETGLSIYGESGEIKHKPAENADLGMAVSELELALTADLLERKSAFIYGDFKDFFAREPALAEMKLTDMLHLTLGEYANSAHPGKKFWSNFIRALGFESNGEFDAVLVGDSVERINAAQTLWLAYMAAGQAFAGRQKAALPIDVFLRASHGPTLASEVQAPGAFKSMLITTTMVNALGNGRIAKHVAAMNAMGYPPEEALIELAYCYLFRFGCHLSGKLSGSPLIRTKIKGQSGGDRNLDVVLTFSISARARAAFHKAQSFLSKPWPLPANGPLSSTAELNAGIEGPPRFFPANQPQWHHQQAPGKYRVVLRGSTQTENYSSSAAPVEFFDRMILGVGLPELMFFKHSAVKQFVGIPVRDWRQPGVHVFYSVSIKGNGSSQNADGGTTEWGSFSSISLNVSLPTEVPMGSETIWMMEIGPGFHKEIDSYELKSYTRTTHPGECGADGSLAEFTSQTVFRPKKGPGDGKLDFSQVMFRVDAAARKYSLTLPLDRLMVPVTASSYNPIHGRTPPVDTTASPWITSFNPPAPGALQILLPNEFKDIPMNGVPAGPALPGVTKYDTNFKLKSGEYTATGNLTVYLRAKK